MKIKLRILKIILSATTILLSDILLNDIISIYLSIGDVVSCGILFRGIRKLGFSLEDTEKCHLV
jgi:hypothetical protein